MSLLPSTFFLVLCGVCNSFFFFCKLIQCLGKIVAQPNQCLRAFIAVSYISLKSFRETILGKFSVGDFLRWSVLHLMMEAFSQGLQLIVLDQAVTTLLPFQCKQVCDITLQLPFCGGWSTVEGASFSPEFHQQLWRFFKMEFPCEAGLGRFLQLTHNLSL